MFDVSVFMSYPCCTLTNRIWRFAQYLVFWTFYFQGTKKVCLNMTCITGGSGKGLQSMNFVQYSHSTGATMESCVWEVFLEQGSPHEWACTIIPSVCLLSFLLPFVLFLISCLQLPHIFRRHSACLCVFVHVVLWHWLNRQEVFP